MEKWREFVRSMTGVVSEADDACDASAPIASVGDSYKALRRGSALVDRTSRGLMELKGADAASWLHSFTTNHVKTLGVGDGSYAFACNAQGRILFDLNIFVRADALWIDIDREFLDTAKAHFDRYIIVEDVAVIDRSDDFVRMGLAGERAAEVLADLGAPQGAILPLFGQAAITIDGLDVDLVRTDFCGVFGVELFVALDRAVEVWQWLTDVRRKLPAIPVGSDAVEACRIEFGLPWPKSEISDEYLPAETGQFARAVSYNKGCYLGQEVVERMRSRDVVARMLIGFATTTEPLPEPGAVLMAGDKPVGAVTSVCCHPRGHGALGLAYVKTMASEVGTALAVSCGDGSTDAIVVELPLEMAAPA